MTEYQYTKAPVNIGRLTLEIRISEITAALDHMNLLGSALSIFFKADISNDEKTTLDGIVSAHTGEALPSDPQTVNVGGIVQTQITSQPPFAEPLYRTKFDATDSVLTVAPEGIESVDFLLMEERWIYGGSACVKNAQIGDYITAEVYDEYGIIPEAYRAALCESWPTVNKYVKKMWVIPQGEYTKFEINTYPLIAKIIAYLFLRITYHAAASGSNREVVMNYFLTKRL